MDKPEETDLCCQGNLNAVSFLDVSHSPRKEAWERRQVGAEEAPDPRVCGSRKGHRCPLSPRSPREAGANRRAGTNPRQQGLRGTRKEEGEGAPV